MQQAGPGYLAVATRMHFQRYLSIYSPLAIRQSRYKKYLFYQAQQNDVLIVL